MSDEGSQVSDERLLAIYADVERSPREREEAFRLLVTRFQRRVFAVCARLLDQPADAEEATQETFVKLARGADAFRGEAKVSTWVYRIAHNVCTDRIRYEARRPSTPVASDELPEAAEPGDLAALVDTTDALGRALMELDATSRTLLLLVAVDDLSYADAAHALGLAVGTVKSRLARARVRLGELLAESEPEGEDVEVPRPSPTGERPGALPNDRGPPGSDRTG